MLPSDGSFSKVQIACIYLNQLLGLLRVGGQNVSGEGEGICCCLVPCTT